MQAWKYNWKLDGFIYDIVCLHCGCSFKASYCETAEEAIAKWNTRAERTCTMKQDGMFLVCSECGVVLMGNPSYCSRCGAKVVER